MKKDPKDPIGSMILALAILGALALGIDWSKFSNFGQTSAPVSVHKKTEANQPVRGFGPQCDLSDDFAPCTHRPVVTQEGR